MLTQFYAIGLNDDQNRSLNALVARQWGRRTDMRRYIGQHVGANQRFYSEADYRIVRETQESFLGDVGVEVQGGIYSLVERGQ